MKQGCFLLAESGRPLWSDVRVMEGWVERYYGLRKYPKLPANRALWFPRCGAIHSMGMQVAIDVVGLNKYGQIMAVKRNMQPWQVLRFAHVDSVIECEAGVALPLEYWLGKQLSFVNKDSDYVAL